MKLFSYIYFKVLAWSGHRHAPYYLAGVSVAESSVFPVPPDVMLISMGLAKPDRVWHYAALTTICSVLGGIIGYIIGAFFFHLAEPYILQFGYEQAYLTVHHWFEKWGFWIIFIAGFTPVPYKLFTIAAGTIHMAFPIFIIASLISRGARFFLVSGCVYYLGPTIKNNLHRYIDRIGWTVLLLLLIAFAIYQVS